MKRSRLKAIYHASRPRLQGPQAYPLHDHEFGEVAWLDEGEALVHRIGGREETLANGSLLFIRPWDAHSYHGVGRKPVFLVNICFQWRLLEVFQHRYFGERDPYGAIGKAPIHLRLTPAQKKGLKAGFLTLLKAPVSAFQIERFLMNLFAEVAPPPESDPLSRAPDWMQRAWHTIQRPEHLAGGVQEFCRLCGRSPEHVSREFHRITGETVVRRLARLKVQHAAVLLAGTTVPIVEIAGDVGFESLSHFYACFRREVGASPLVYRRQAQQRPEVR